MAITNPRSKKSEINGHQTLGRFHGIPLVQPLISNKEIRISRTKSRPTCSRLLNRLKRYSTLVTEYDLTPRNIQKSKISPDPYNKVFQNL